MPLRLTPAESATDAAVEKKIFESGMTKLIISIQEINDIMEMVISLEESGLLIVNVSKTIKNQLREQKRWISQDVTRYIRGLFIRKSLSRLWHNQSWDF